MIFLIFKMRNLLIYKFHGDILLDRKCYLANLSLFSTTVTFLLLTCRLRWRVLYNFTSFVIYLSNVTFSTWKQASFYQIIPLIGSKPVHLFCFS